MTHKFIHVLAYAMLAATAAVALVLPQGLGIELATAAPATSEHVQVELVLLVDTSGSVDNTEYMMQRQGYAEAFRNPTFIDVVQNRGGLAVLYVEWDNVDNQSVRIAWTRLDTEADCLAYATEIDGLVRATSGSTVMSAAIEFAVSEIQGNSYRALRRIIDVSGDGICKNWNYHQGGTADDDSSDAGGSTAWGTPWDDVMVSAAGQVDQINGICITTNASVADFYMNVVPMGSASFAMQVGNFTDFSAAILQKLVREVGSAPPIYD